MLDLNVLPVLTLFNVSVEFGNLQALSFNEPLSFKAMIAGGDTIRVGVSQR